MSDTPYAARVMAYADEFAGITPARCRTLNELLADERIDRARELLDVEPLLRHVVTLDVLTDVLEAYETLLFARAWELAAALPTDEE